MARDRSPAPSDTGSPRPPPPIASVEPRAQHHRIPVRTDPIPPLDRLPHSRSATRGHRTSPPTHHKRHTPPSRRTSRSRLRTRPAPPHLRQSPSRNMLCIHHRLRTRNRASTDPQSSVRYRPRAPLRSVAATRVSTYLRGCGSQCTSGGRTSGERPPRGREATPYCAPVLHRPDTRSAGRAVSRCGVRHPRVGRFLNRSRLRPAFHEYGAGATLARPPPIASVEPRPPHTTSTASENPPA